MSGSAEKIAFTQPEHFAFTPENLEAANAIIARYPSGRQQSAVMPLLALAQRQNSNWLPEIAMDVIAEMLGMPPVRVYEVASFYTMYNLSPVGKNLLNVCTTTPCWLKGSDAIMSACENHLHIKGGQTTPDGAFTLREVECLGACVNAPMMQVQNHMGEHFYEDLTTENTVKLLDMLARGDRIKHGPQTGRRSSEPEGSSPVYPRHVTSTDSTPAHGVSAKTAHDTVQAEAPGNHPEGAKRYSGEPNNKKKES